MKIRIKSNYLTRYVLQDYDNKEALLPFSVCLVSIYLFFVRSHLFFFLCQFTVWRIFFFAFLLWSQMMENSWIHLSLIHLNSFILFVVFGIFDFCSTLYRFSEQRKERIVSHNLCVCMIWAKDCYRSSRLASFCSYSDKLHREWKLRYAYGML